MLISAKLFSSCSHFHQFPLNHDCWRNRNTRSHKVVPIWCIFTRPVHREFLSISVKYSRVKVQQENWSLKSPTCWSNLIWQTHHDGPFKCDYHGLEHAISDMLLDALKEQKRTDFGQIWVFESIFCASNWASLDRSLWSFSVKGRSSGSTQKSLWTFVLIWPDFGSPWNFLKWRMTGEFFRDENIDAGRTILTIEAVAATPTITTPPACFRKNTHLVGGFKYFLFSPLFGGNDPFWLIFFKWVGSTTN